MILRALSLLAAVLMVLFMLVQYNDPDALMWIALYAVPALANLLASFNTVWWRSRSGRRLLALSAVVLLGSVVLYWPSSEGWWHKSVWWNDEGAREGMGLMIALLAMVPAVWIALGRGQGRFSGTYGS